MADARMKETPAQDRASERASMVDRIVELMQATTAETGISELEPRVREALEAVPRHRFVPPEMAHAAYADAALPVGFGQTISQPFIVALMTQLAQVGPDTVALEIGTGSGYQAAVLAALAKRVYSIELVPELSERAGAALEAQGIENVELRCGDGFGGWDEHAPYDAILVTAATPEPPPPLVAQLAVGGRMVIPLGQPSRTQELALLQKGPDGTIETIRELSVAFVPLIHEDDEAADS